MTKEERIALSERLFVSGYNCSQSVVAAFADIYGFTEEQALRMSAGFGGGIGRMRLTCGAVCALALLAGLEHGAVDGDDSEAKSNCYRVTQLFADRFREEHGSIVCAELLKLKKGQPLSFVASPRTAEYYRTRPCVNQVITATRIFADYLENKE